ncbi:MAG TPA: hypothetical protein VFN35_13935 [Ktedonobacteraceae bacterium]|nr:hypothetical protein [Ktedonobacteraceae bacterium]
MEQGLKGQEVFSGQRQFSLNRPWQTERKASGGIARQTTAHLWQQPANLALQSFMTILSTIVDTDQYNQPLIPG